MKVIQINSECGRGSTGKIAVAISEQLSKNGIENYIYYSGNHRSVYPKGWMIAGKYSIRIHQLLSRILGDQGFHSKRATKRLVKRLEKESPDVILLHNLHGYYLHLKVLFEYLGKFDGKVFWTLHDCWTFTGHCTHFTIAKCDKWRTGCYQCPQKEKYPYSWFFDRSKKLYEVKRNLFLKVKDMTIITPSRWLAEKVKDSFWGDVPVEIINNGIDRKIFYPRESDFRKKYGIERRYMILGVSAVWNYEKGLDVFIELAKRLNSDKYQIVLVGTDKKIDQMLPEQVISIHRTQDQVELAEIYTAADVFVNPTREDNYPTVNMEAIACGTPVVAFDTGGCSETIEMDCGYVADENSVEKCIEGIKVVIENKETLVDACLQKAKRFDQIYCFEKYVNLICR